MVMRQRTPALERSNMTFRGTGPSSEVCDEPRTILFILCSVAVLLQATSNKPSYFTHAGFYGRTVGPSV
uniref:Uncharacterized protein n=1 Tax=Hyaloperonospora arabidopsidis (strain Emoy2) TaxID=559515 RepID=M4B8L5_HYAAE